MREEWLALEAFGQGDWLPNSRPITVQGNGVKVWALGIKVEDNSNDLTFAKGTVLDLCAFLSGNTLPITVKIDARGSVEEQARARSGESNPQQFVGAFLLAV